MKTLIPILFAIILLTSCKKEETYCWKCDLYSYYGYWLKSTDYCDKTEKEIIEIEHEVSGYQCTKR